MSRDRVEFEPTHVLCCPSNETSEAVHTVNEALSVVFDHCDSVSLWLDDDLLASDHPELCAELLTALDRHGDTQLRGSIAECRGPLRRLLELTSFHRAVSLERLDVHRDGALVCHHVFDHDIFEIDDSDVPELVPAIRAAIDEEQGGVLPAQRLARWHADGTTYELRPPWFCIDDRACVRLSTITAVEIAEREGTITIEWSQPRGSNRLGRLIETCLSWLAPDTPDRLEFESDETFERVAPAFERIGAELHW